MSSDSPNFLKQQNLNQRVHSQNIYSLPVGRRSPCHKWASPEVRTAEGMAFSDEDWLSACDLGSPAVWAGLSGQNDLASADLRVD